jgi:uncharacterized protein (TIGR02611 family)
MDSSSRRRPIVERLREQRERHKGRPRIYRIAVALAGVVVLLAGLAMIPLPGPGLLVSAVGLALLALEFAWAERMLERTIDRMERAGQAVEQASALQKGLLGLLGALAAAAAITAAYAWDLPFLPV